MTDAEQHALCDAARDHVWAKVKSIIKKDPSLVDSQPAGRYSALHQAAEFGSLDVCKFLIEKYEASLDVLTKDGKTPLEIADNKCKDYLTTAEEHAFLTAARERNWAQVTAKLDRKPGLVDCQVAGRWSALHQASEAGSLETCKLLVEKYGASLEGKTKDGKTPLDVAHKSCKSWLLSAGGSSSAAGGSTSEPPSKKPKKK